MTETALKSARIATQDGVAEVVLLGPGKGNAMGPDFWREMPEIFAKLDADPAVRCVLLRGEGKHFSFGLDVQAMSGTLGPLLMGENLAKGRTALLDLIGEMQKAANAVAQCRKPVIAAVAGWCIGAGVDLIAACDVRLASADAKFSVREVKLAIVADIGSLQRLPRIIGEGATRELALTGKDIDANRAAAMGLVNEVFPEADSLLAAARAMAKEIAANPPLVVQGTKHMLDYCADKSVADGLRYGAVWNAAFLQSKDFQEALMAFMQKRPATFTGE